MNKMFDLSGKKCIVTGGGRGIGKAMAEALHEFGADVVLIGTSEAVEKVAGELSGARAVRADLGNRDALRRAFAESVDMLGGRLDLLVNNAGTISRAKSEDFSLEEWDRVLELNLTSVFELCQLAGRIMLEQGSGKIINVASLISFFGGYTIPAYAASKGGVAQLTKALSNEWAGRGVCVNAVAPGYIATDLNVALRNDPGRYQEVTSRIPAGRWGAPEDLKGITVFLASAASDYMSGTVIPVDGGYCGR